jgi:hypothetical protein
MAIRQASETIGPEVGQDPNAVLVEVESHLRNRFRKRVVDRFFNRGGNMEAIEASRKKVLQLWEQVQRRRECLSRLIELISLIALRKARMVSDQVLLEDLRKLMREACRSPVPCGKCQMRENCRWVNSLAFELVSGEKYAPSRNASR